MDEKDHSIRFINSNYDTLFRIPDGSIVEVRFPDRAFSAKCEYLDDYHTLVGDTVFHICEFAEMVERQGGSVLPEPETALDKAAWQLAHREYHVVERTDSGFRYELLTQQFQSKIQGQVDRPGWTMNQAREYILDTLNISIPIVGSKNGQYMRNFHTRHNAERDTFTSFFKTFSCCQLHWLFLSNQHSRSITGTHT